MIPKKHFTLIREKYIQKLLFLILLLGTSKLYSQSIEIHTDTIYNKDSYRIR